MRLTILSMLVASLFPCLVDSTYGQEKSDIWEEEAGDFLREAKSDIWAEEDGDFLWESKSDIWELESGDFLWESKSDMWGEESGDFLWERKSDIWGEESGDFIWREEDAAGRSSAAPLTRVSTNNLAMNTPSATRWLAFCAANR